MEVDFVILLLPLEFCCSGFGFCLRRLAFNFVRKNPLKMEGIEVIARLILKKNPSLRSSCLAWYSIYSLIVIGSGFFAGGGFGSLFLNSWLSRYSLRVRRSVLVY